MTGDRSAAHEHPSAELGAGPWQGAGEVPAFATKAPPDCPGAPLLRVRAGDRARVCTAHDRLVVCAQPGRSGAEVTRLEPGTDITILGDPTCADGSSWWEIRTESGVAGWVAEGGDEVDPYYICPAR